MHLTHYVENFLEDISQLTLKRRFVHMLLFSFGLIYIFLMKICLQWNKRLGPIGHVLFFFPKKTWWPSDHQWTNVFLMYNLCIAQCSKKWFFSSNCSYSILFLVAHYAQLTLHIDTLILPAIIMIIVSVHDFPMLGQLKQLWVENHGRRRFSKLWREGSLYLYVMWCNLTFQTS